MEKLIYTNIRTHGYNKSLHTFITRTKYIADGVEIIKTFTVDHCPYMYSETCLIDIGRCGMSDNERTVHPSHNLQK